MNAQPTKRSLCVTQRSGFVRVLSLLIGTVILGCCMLTTYVYVQNLPPDPFPVDSPIVVTEGTSVQEIASQFAETGYVRSEFLFYALLVLRYEPTDIKASTYVFDQPQSMQTIAARLTDGDFRQDLVAFVHYEGESVADIAEHANRELGQFDTQTFLENARSLEGRLFPDTYYVPSNYDATELIALMQETYEANIATLQTQINQSDLSEREIIILASILEREANSSESRRLVSGVLQNRLAIDMPLQTDASIEYTLDKPLSELTPEDLTVESPYNTYLNRGLPPTPIGNPGLDAIRAVLNPADTNYMYYITAPDGTFYYAETLTGHQANVDRYLR